MDGTPCARCRDDGDWVESTRFALARLNATLETAKREAFELAFRTFAAALSPPPSTIVESWLRDRLVVVCDAAAAALHGHEHCRSRSRCCLPSANHFHDIWHRTGCAPQHQLRRWLARVLRAFDAAHPVGVPVRTARVLTRRPHVYVSMETVARRMGCSRHVLDRRFDGRYGLTPKAFHTRVRVRAAVLLLTTSSIKVEAAARHAGYEGLRNFYAALEKCTGLSPSEVRALPRAALETLITHGLEINPAKLFEAARAEPRRALPVWCDAGLASWAPDA